MSPRSQFLGAVVLAAITVVLALVDGGLFIHNQSLQQDVDQRQQFIAESARLGTLNESLTRALAVSAYNNNDAAIKQMLHESGIDFTVTPTTPAAGAPPAAPAAPASATPSAGK